jgi:hypothetical protein
VATGPRSIGISDAYRVTTTGDDNEGHAGNYEQVNAIAHAIHCE